MDDLTVLAAHFLLADRRLDSTWNTRKAFEYSGKSAEAEFYYPFALKSERTSLECGIN